jgi:hypothetical protein
MALSYPLLSLRPPVQIFLDYFCRPRSEFRHPSGTQAHGVPEPGDKSPGYCHLSLRDAFWPGTGYFLMIPGTSCLTTIVLSLRDKNNSPLERPRNYLSAYSPSNNLLANVRCAFSSADALLSSLEVL